MNVSDLRARNACAGGGGGGVGALPEKLAGWRLLFEPLPETPRCRAEGFFGTSLTHGEARWPPYDYAPGFSGAVLAWWRQSPVRRFQAIGSRGRARPRMLDRIARNASHSFASSIAGS
jgi:hypothetical protein